MLSTDLKNLKPADLPRWYQAMKAQGLFKQLLPMQVASFAPRPIEIDTEANDDRTRLQIETSSKDAEPACYLGIDQQVGFAFPGASLYVNGAEDDCERAMEMILRWPRAFSYMALSLDTHFAYQIFHPTFWVDTKGQNPKPGTKITSADLRSGAWRPAVTQYTHEAIEYVGSLEAQGLYELIIWPFHTLEGTEDKALMPVVSRTMLYHSILRRYQTHLEAKGGHSLTEHYSIMGPEVKMLRGSPTIDFNAKFMDLLLNFHRIVVAGEAKDFCVLRTLQDLLSNVFKKDPSLTRKVVVLTDCMSPVYPGGGEQQIQQLVQQYGITLKKSTDHISDILA